MGIHLIVSFLLKILTHVWPSIHDVFLLSMHGSLLFVCKIMWRDLFPPTRSRVIILLYYTCDRRGKFER